MEAQSSWGARALAWASVAFAAVGASALCCGGLGTVAHWLGLGVVCVAGAPAAIFGAFALWAGARGRHRAMAGLAALSPALTFGVWLAIANQDAVARLVERFNPFLTRGDVLGLAMGLGDPLPVEAAPPPDAVSEGTRIARMRDAAGSFHASSRAERDLERALEDRLAASAVALERVGEAESWIPGPEELAVSVVASFDEDLRKPAVFKWGEWLLGGLALSAFTSDCRDHEARLRDTIAELRPLLGPPGGGPDLRVEYVPRWEGIFEEQVLLTNRSGALPEAAVFVSFGAEGGSRDAYLFHVEEWPAGATRVVRFPSSKFRAPRPEARPAKVEVDVFTAQGGAHYEPDCDEAIVKYAEGRPLTVEYVTEEPYGTVVPSLGASGVEISTGEGPCVPVGTIRATAFAREREPVTATWEGDRCLQKEQLRSATLNDIVPDRIEVEAEVPGTTAKLRGTWVAP